MGQKKTLQEKCYNLTRRKTNKRTLQEKIYSLMYQKMNKKTFQEKFYNLTHQKTSKSRNKKLLNIICLEMMELIKRCQRILEWKKPLYKYQNIQQHNIKTNRKEQQN